MDRPFIYLTARHKALIWLALGFVASIGESCAQTASPPVGFLTLNIPANSAQAVSLPLRQQAAYSGAVSSLTTNTVTVTGANWTANAYGPFSSNPYVISFTSGVSQGRVFPISSNTTTALTLNTSDNITQVVAAGDTFEIIPADTLASLFGATASGLLTGGTSSTSDNILINTTTGWLTYYNNGTNWLRQGGGSTVQNSTAILPTQGFIIVRNGSTTLTLQLSGRVPVAQSQIEIPGNQTTFMANPFPINTTLSGLGIQKNANWVSGTSSSAADNILINTTVGWLTYYYNGANWLRQGGGTTNQNNTTVAQGSAVLVVHQGATTFVNTLAPSYTQ